MISKYHKTKHERLGVARYEPTPEEIAAATAEIQAGWSDKERQRRSELAGRIPWRIQMTKPLLGHGKSVEGRE